MRYLRNCWYVAAWSDEVTDDGLLARTILDDPIVPFRDGRWRCETAVRTASSRYRWGDARAKVSRAAITV